MCLLNQLAEIEATPALQLSPLAIPSQIDPLRYPLLRSLPTLALRLRFEALRALNQGLQQTLPLIDLLQTSAEASLAQRIHRLRYMSLDCYPQ